MSSLVLILASALRALRHETHRVALPFCITVISVTGPGAGALLLNPHAAPFTGTPYTGTPLSLPARIEAENFDNGGEGIAYHDTTATNDGGYYRSEGVDVCSCGSPYGLSVGWTQNAEWMEYTVSVATFGTYKFKPLTATIINGSALHIEVDGVNATGQMILPNTNAWGSYATTVSPAVSLTAGQHIVRVVVDVTGFLLDSIDVTRASTPYGGTAPQLPGTIQSKNFDDGGEGVAYHDTTSANEGGAYRSEGVDLCMCSSATGAALGWSAAGEWTKYTVNFSTTDTYTLQASMSTIVSGCTIHLELDGVNVTGPLVLPNTGGWGNWQTVSKSNVQISAGQHELKMVIETGGFLLDSYSAIPSLPSAPSALTASAVSANQINLAWTDNSSNESGFKIERKTGPSGSYSEIATTAAGISSFSNTGLQSNTQYFYRLRATNLGGNSAYSNEANATTSNLLPSVTLTAPAAGSVFNAPSNITINASAADADGTVSKVEFFQGATKLGEDLTAPYSFSWTNITAGTYNLTAKATDNFGGSTTSAGVSIIVNALPTISLTAPAAGATFATGSTVSIAATSSDTDGTISKVEFYQGATKLGEDVTSPFAFAWSNVQQGSYSLSAVATDNRGASTTSTTVLITVVGSSISRLDPMNHTGGSGEDPLSRNFNWTLPLVSLPGRAGMDLDLALSYNSLVWTRNGNFISFDDDRGFPSPGFRLGFPVIQPLYYNAEVGKYAFLLINPDGSRSELRQVGTSTLYEAADSSYLLLNANSMTLQTTDGTQLSYAMIGSEYNCTKILDRNGNYITINYTQFGRIDTIIDTLARSIKFNYDANGWLTSITQIWNQGLASQVTHNWATFTYANTTIQTSFTGLTAYGPSNNSTIKTLSRVTLADGSHSDFTYTSWGQVWKVSGFAPDNHLLNSRAYNLPGSLLLSTSSQTDCPRFTQRRDWAQYWNGDTDGTAPVDEETIATEQAVTTFTVPVSDAWTMPNNTQQTGIRTQVTAPDGTSNKIYFIGAAGTSSGWRRGLPALVNTYDSAGVLQRQAMTTWTQDPPDISYPLNPRVTETNVYDPQGNRARTEITYQQFNFSNGTSCQLPRNIYEYTADPDIKLRSTQTDYNTNDSYKDRRILLVSEKRIYAGDVNSGGALVSRTAYFYDESGSVSGSGAPVQHDPTYDSNSVSGRGNLSSIKRYDVPTDTSITVTRTKYNTAGAVVSVKDALDHEIQISYADSFSDNISRNTLAYPTIITDPDGYSSSSKYSFDFGAVTYKRTPQPNTIQNLAGPEQSFSFDAIGRLQQVDNLVNGAYTRFEYGLTGVRVDTYTTIQDGLGEAHSFKITDGAGRVIATATDHPSTVNRFSGQRMVYDIMGRVIKTSNPTETTASGAPSQWNTTGDDAAAGWIYTQQTYDWKGRPLVTTNQDGTTKTVSYQGCGCAGGEVLTLTDEGTLSGGLPKRRQQKIYSDVLGRTWKTEVFNWDGTGPNGMAPGNTVYSTTINTYNVRDQITAIRQYRGDSSSTAFQDTTMSYDGYGRLKTRHLPEQQVDPNNSASTDNTTWDYNTDDTVLKVTDARGVVSTMSYNARHLMTGVTYTLLPGVPAVGSSAVASTPAVTFGYDAAGNRTSRSDGTGSINYQYNSLSQLTSETRKFVGPFSNSSFGLNYEYTIGGQLKKITDHTNATIKYSYNKMGGLTTVTGENNLVNGVSAYASNLEYRASGALRDINYGNGTHQHADYNQRLLPSAATISNLSSNASMSWSYDYYADGRIRHAYDAANDHFDRAQEYDQLGRLTEAYSGREARGLAASTPLPDSPYRQTFQYDEWDNQIARTGRFWRQILGDSADYSNNRRTGGTYDAEGNGLLIVDNAQTYDAANKVLHFINWHNTVGGGLTGHELRATIEIGQTYDGDGQPAKRVETRRREELVNGGPTTNIIEEVTTTYEIYSSVLGAKVVELDENGQKRNGYVYVNGEQLARQTLSPSVGVTWLHPNPGSTSWVETSSPDPVRQEMDPLGAEVGTVDPWADTGVAEPNYEGLIGREQPLYMEGGDPFDYVSGYTLDGLPMTRSQLNRLVGKAGTNGILLFDVYGPRLEPIPQTDLKNLSWGYIGTIGVELPRPRTAQPQNAIPNDELAGIRSDVERAISAQKCADFLKSLLDETAVQTDQPYRDVMVTFDNTKFSYGDPGNGHGGLAPGSFEDGTAAAILRPFNEPFISADRSSFIRTQTAQNALGETLHHVGTHEAYDDAAMATALNAIYVRQGKDTHKTFSSKSMAEINSASNYWHPRVFDACSMKY